MKKTIKEFKPITGVSEKKRIPLSIGLELTSRCNLNCRHCYINRPASEKGHTELSLEEIDRVSGEALDLGTLWFLLSGGEPLVRQDFPDIFLMLKKKGFLVNVLTNATLITKSHANLFKKYPPRTIEISAYGATSETYERVTGSQDGFNKFLRGLTLCMDAGLDIILKTVATRSLHREIEDMKALVSGYDRAVLRVEDQLISRIDRDQEKSARIARERLKLNTTAPCRTEASQGSLKENQWGGNLFFCNAGINSCWIASDGTAHLCTTLREPSLAVGLRKVSLKEFWYEHAPRILGLCSYKTEYINGCYNCEFKAECNWCPAMSWVETGRLDQPVGCFNRFRKTDAGP